MAGKPVKMSPPPSDSSGRTYGLGLGLIIGALLGGLAGALTLLILQLQREDVVNRLTTPPADTSTSVIEIPRPTVIPSEPPVTSETAQAQLSIVRTVPGNGDTEINPDNFLLVEFSADMDGATLNPQTVGVMDVTAGTDLTNRFTFAYADREFRLTIADEAYKLPSAHTLRVTLSGSVMSLAGQSLAGGYEFSFTTR